MLDPGVDLRGSGVSAACRQRLQDRLPLRRHSKVGRWLRGDAAGHRAP
jgi:hypothetical protein